MRPPDRMIESGRESWDLQLEGARYRLSMDVLQQLWGRACAETTDGVGGWEDDQARLRFHDLAARFAAGDRTRTAIGKVTQVELDGGCTPWIDAHVLAPGRETLVEHEARRWSSSTAAEDGRQASGPNDHRVRGPGSLGQTVPATLYRRAASGGASGEDPRAVGAALQQRGAGHALPVELRHRMERELGVSLAGVRIHTDPVAAQAARVLGAEAFTVGKDIFFAEGMFAPDTRSGRKLLAHELAHVAQMVLGDLAAAVQGLRVSQPGEPLEREADAVAEHADRAALAHADPDHTATAARQARAVADRELGPATLIQRQATSPVAGPPAPTGAGNDFDAFLLQFTALETAALAEGYAFNSLITAFRKLFYDSASAVKTYAGSAVSGGVWNILIPSAAGTGLPASWTTGSLVGAADYLRKHQVLNIAGNQVDIGHMLAGVDAAKHPASISLAAGAITLRSNQEAATFVGDLGSVVTEYIHGSTASFRDTAMVRSAALDGYYDGAHAMAGAEDMAGNADSYALTLDPSKSLSRNLKDYYAAASGGANKRYTRFAAAIGLGALLAGTRFAGDTEAWRRAMTDQVFNAALAYAAGKGWKSDVVNVFSDPGPGIFAPTVWEEYFNISGWVVEIFVSRVAAAVATE